MNARDLVELAVLAVSDAGWLLTAEQPLVEGALKTYWTASKCRQVRWHAVFKNYHEQMESDRTVEVREAWRVVRPVLDEVLGSEILSRVWAAILCQRDVLRGTPEGGPIARSVLVGHYEARHRALNVMVYGRGSSIAEAAHLNRLRRRYEQWSDLLLGALQPRCDVEEFAIEVPRVRRFAAALLYQGHDISLSPAWQWIRATLRSSFLDHVVSCSPNEDLNEQIAASVLELFGTQRSGLMETLPSPWLARLGRPSSDSRGDVQQVLFSAQERRGRCSPAALRFDGPHPLRPRYRR